MRSIMVAIEGSDLMGKTTIAKNLSEMDGWQYYKTPPKEYYNDCVKLGTNGEPVYTDERFWLFIECLKYSSQEILKFLDQDVSVVVDRWIWTTLAYHFTFNKNLEARLQETLDEKISAIIKPHLNFLIHITDNNVYESRKLCRKELTSYDKIVVNDEKRRKTIFNNYQRLTPNFVLIDNSGDLGSTMKVVRRSIDTFKAH